MVQKMQFIQTYDHEAIGLYAYFLAFAKPMYSLENTAGQAGYSIGNPKRTFELLHLLQWLLRCPPPAVHRCKKNVFYVLYSGHVFFTFFNVLYFSNVFYFLKRSFKIPSEITFETTETNWVCMIGFLCAHVRISILTSIVIYLPYRLTSSDATRRFVFLFMLVNWWVEKHQRFLFNVYKRFCKILSRFFLRFLTFFIFFLERFYIYAACSQPVWIHAADFISMLRTRGLFTCILLLQGNSGAE